MRDNTNFSNLSDQELLIRIKDNTDYLNVIYNSCKSNSIYFMKKMTNGNISGYDYEDVFQDATIVLYENILKEDFVLTVKFQTYINSVCRNILLTQFWYKRKSMRELTEIFEYTNEGNTKNQKSKCQERLRILSFNELKLINE